MVLASLSMKLASCWIDVEAVGQGRQEGVLAGRVGLDGDACRRVDLGCLFWRADAGCQFVDRCGLTQLLLQERFGFRL